MRYVVESFVPNVGQSQVVVVVERVFVSAGSRQYSTVECDIAHGHFRKMGCGLNKLMQQLAKVQWSI
jgi:hypothetical protein